jgi:hypothetical protein
MQTMDKTARHDAGGYALTLTIMVAAVMLAVFASMMLWVSSNAKTTQRNNQYNASQAAAEAATERVLARMDADFQAQSISNASAYVSLPGTINQSGWPVNYVFSDTNGNVGQISVNIGTTTTTTVPLYSQYIGLYGLEQDVTLTAFATPTNQPQNVPAEIIEAVQFASIPLFQFAIFYNINLEIAPGQNMTITGPVFCNQSIWEGAADTTYQSTVTAVGTNNTTTADPFSNGYTDTGGPTFVKAGQPVSGANALVMPIAGATNSNPTNVESILQLPPAAYATGTSGAYSGGGTNYLANEADLFITNIISGTNSASPTGTNTFVYYQDQYNSPYLTFMTPDFYKLKIAATTGLYTNYVTSNKADTNRCYTNVQYASYSFITNVAFKDWRESDTVQAVQIDVAKFSLWVTNTGYNGGNIVDQLKVAHVTHHIDSMYVYNYVPLTTTTLPAVRVVNGQQLPSPGNQHNGFTVATAMPLYVLGNYNSQTPSGSSLGVNSTGANAWPAGFMADAITVLSTNWADSLAPTEPSPLPTAGNTTINAACLEGIVPSNPAISGNYSGGVENFLRLLEDWSSATLTYNGSIVVMFPSVYATNVWSYGTYYDAPTRHWAFDTNFELQAGLPPLTPQIKGMIRGQWTAQ